MYLDLKLKYVVYFVFRYFGLNLIIVIEGLENLESLREFYIEK